VARDLGAPDPKLSEKARETDARWVAHRNVGYFEENRSRMDYPTYRARGLPIGSGVVESSCKHVVADRMKRTGMRWDEDGAESVLALRSLDLNHRWDSLWPGKEAG
jgi:2-phosphoglycerate kinase